MNQYKGYSLFNDVSNKRIQAYNRMVVSFNIYSDLKNDVDVQKYASHFSGEEYRLMIEMGELVKEKGVAAAKATF